MRRLTKAILGYPLLVAILHDPDDYQQSKAVIHAHLAVDAVNSTIADWNLNNNASELCYLTSKNTNIAETTTRSIYPGVRQGLKTPDIQSGLIGPCPGQIISLALTVVALISSPNKHYKSSRISTAFCLADRASRTILNVAITFFRR